MARSTRQVTISPGRAVFPAARETSFSASVCLILARGTPAALFRRLDEVGAPAHLADAELAQLDRQLGALGDERNAVDDRRAVHLAREQHHRQPAGRHDHVCTCVEEGFAFAFPKGLQLLQSLFARKRVDEVAHLGVHSAHADHPLLQSVADHLVLVPGNEHGIDGDEPELASERAGVEQGRLA